MDPLVAVDLLTTWGPRGVRTGWGANRVGREDLVNGALGAISL